MKAGKPILAFVVCLQQQSPFVTSTLAPGRGVLYSSCTGSIVQAYLSCERTFVYCELRPLRNSASCCIYFVNALTLPLPKRGNRN